MPDDDHFMWLDEGGDDKIVVGGEVAVGVGSGFGESRGKKSKMVGE